ncbi:MAG: hypothetical protein GY814_17095 [Gammaproteobacteria bacterium]|nr:hypothetical protein [Gammaproteobacteria bacterium]
MLSNLKNVVIHTVLAASFTALPLKDAVAGPGSLPSAPLFLSNIVEPNIYFTLDDSGSMQLEMMVKDGTGGYDAPWGAPIIGTPGQMIYRRRFHSLPGFWGTILPPANLPYQFAQDAWIFKTHHANTLYYNPDVTYTPWSGTDAFGNPMYTDADPEDVLWHPNHPWTHPTWDLTQWYDFSVISGPGTPTNPVLEVDVLWHPTYYIWNDTDGDGRIEPADDHTRVEIAAGTAEMQNFANWFQYYRTRELSAKAAIGRVINESSTVRMGLQALRAGHLADLTTMTDLTNKHSLLDAFYTSFAGGGTAARRALTRAGNLFASNDPDAPILPATQGGQCQQNFNMLMTDGYWNGPDQGVGNTDSDGPGDFDGDSNQSNDGGNYADTHADTLADAAMKYYEEDLRPDLANRVPTTANIDEADHQHLVTYTIAFGVSGTLDASEDSPTDNGFEWPNAFDGNNEKVDDLWHAAYNGRGKFLSAHSPDELIKSLNEVIQDISARTGTAAAVAVNSARLSTESVIYLTQFNSDRWEGDLIALQIEDPLTGKLADQPNWQAGKELTTRDISANPRTIITYSNDSGEMDGVPFQWSDISEDMKKDLKTDSTGAQDNANVGKARLDFLRGDRSNEGNGYLFRQRLSVLGDLVNSGPVFVGKPDLNWPDEAPFPVGGQAYSEYKNGAAATRKEIIYTGANDGMLHAYDALTGEEDFAYIPGFFASTMTTEGLHYLSDPGYVHRFYVDQTPTVSDVYFDSTWHTVMVNGVRGGGRGIYALDVTDPGSFKEDNAADIVMWEFTNDDDADLGFTYSRPTIGLANNGRWVAVFGNGYNDTGSGEATLFILDIEKGMDGSWDSGDYIKISTGVGSAANRNGMATPALADLDGNGTIDRVLAGDLEGNMWAFDLSSTNSGLWSSAYGSSPLFTTDNNRPITAKPVLTNHPTIPDINSPSNAPNILVMFGTGHYLVDADKATTDINSFYGVWDKGAGSHSAAQLVKQVQDPSYTSGFFLTRDTVDWSSKYGWYFDLPDTGERSFIYPIVRGDIVYFNSYVPTDDPCSAGGYGFPYAIDIAFGGSADRAIFFDEPDPVTGELEEKHTETKNNVKLSSARGDKRENVAIGDAFLGDRKFTGKDSIQVESLPSLPTGRFSWQELIQ